jgi:hypothetical protein
VDETGGGAALRAGGTGRVSKSAPHDLQNFTPAAFSRPQATHIFLTGGTAAAPSRAPQAGQNFAPGWYSEPQFEHRI